MKKKRIMWGAGRIKAKVQKASAASAMGLEIVTYTERKGSSESESDTYGPWDSRSYCHVTATTSLEEQGRSCWVNLTQKKKKKVLFEPSWVWPQNIIVYKASVKLPNPLTWGVACT